MIPTIRHFLEELRANNNREWFAQHKNQYENARTGFNRICEELILEISKFDDEIKYLAAKDCIFRIYRDIRFSPDKTPYKTHFGAFIAAGGGRKSDRAGYYLHLEPDNCFIAIGAWSPPPTLLHAFRRNIYENIEEFKEIIHLVESSRFFDGFYQRDKLKTAPKGFPKDFPDLELLQLKHYMVEYKFEHDILRDTHFSQQAAQIAQAAYPLKAFLNEAVDEVF